MQQVVGYRRMRDGSKGTIHEAEGRPVFVCHECWSLLTTNTAPLPVSLFDTSDEA